ncbi:MAG: hypothetical protein Q4F30_07530 [Akkermansia sp.]|nr:hypothetical protein [Akkermansia sp.]
MKKLALLLPIGGAVCLAVAAYLLARQSQKDVQDIYGMLNKYE